MDQLHFGVGGLALHVLEDREAIDRARQARIDQNDLEAPRPEVVERLLRIGCLIDIEPVFTQIPRNSTSGRRRRHSE